MAPHTFFSARAGASVGRTALYGLGLLFAGLLAACGDGGASRGDLLLTTEEGMTVYAGELNPEAVTAAENYEQQAVLWLGEEFRGLQLTHVQLMEDGLVLLVYGDCESASGNSEPSCVAPLQIQVRPPGAIPEIARVDPVSFRGVERTVGELAGPPDPDWSSILWLPGSATVKLYVSLEPQGEIMEAALQQLHTANHAALGLPAIGPGEALDTPP